MTEVKKEKPEELHPQIVYTVGGITYVPHYRNPSAFVGPGYGRHHTEQFTADQLLRKGARAEPLMLWKRATVATKEFA